MSSKATAAKVLQAAWAGGVTAATLDFLAAILIYEAPASAVARSIARGWYGAAARTMDTMVEAVGIASHYAILIVAAAIYALASLAAPVLRNRAAICGPLFGAAVYVVMRYVVVPQSHSGASPPTGVHFAEEFAGHLFLVGLPIALWARAILGRG